MQQVTAIATLLITYHLAQNSVSTAPIPIVLGQAENSTLSIQGLRVLRARG